MLWPYLAPVLLLMLMMLDCSMNTSTVLSVMLLCY